MMPPSLSAFAHSAKNAALGRGREDVQFFTNAFIARILVVSLCLVFVLRMLAFECSFVNCAVSHGIPHNSYGIWQVMCVCLCMSIHTGHDWWCTLCSPHFHSRKYANSAGVSDSRISIWQTTDWCGYSHYSRGCTLTIGQKSHQEECYCAALCSCALSHSPHHRGLRTIAASLVYGLGELKGIYHVHADPSRFTYCSITLSDPLLYLPVYLCVSLSLPWWMHSTQRICRRITCARCNKVQAGRSRHVITASHLPGTHSFLCPAKTRHRVGTMHTHTNTHTHIYIYIYIYI